MIPRQLDEVARQHTRTMQSQPRRTASAGGRRDVRRLRQRTGWTLVTIGLRIAAEGGR